MNQQILLSGVGGQGILFITRLLADAAIAKGLPVLTSETHGMAQRGGTVVSHLKAGDFSSPLIRPAQADGLLLLRDENLARHRFYLRPGGWIVMDAHAQPADAREMNIHRVDAGGLAGQLGNYQSMNLILLGFGAARLAGAPGKGSGLFCSAEDIASAIERRLAKREALLKAALEAFGLGVQHGKQQNQIPRGA